MYLAIYLFAAIVACETKEAPSLTCKKMDQTGTTCLDNAQVSAPATAAGTGSGGMTQAQMMQLMTMFQQNQQTGQAFRSLGSNPTAGAVYEASEQGITNYITDLENQITDLNTEKSSATPKRATEIDGEIKKIKNKISNLEIELAKIKREASFLGQAKSMTIEAILQNPGAVAKGTFNFLKLGWNAWQNYQADKVDERASENLGRNYP